MTAEKPKNYWVPRLFDAIDRKGVVHMMGYWTEQLGHGASATVDTGSISWLTAAEFVLAAQQVVDENR
jgi:hypothetical protein